MHNPFFNRIFNEFKLISMKNSVLNSLVLFIIWINLIIYSIAMLNCFLIMSALMFLLEERKN